MIVSVLPLMLQVSMVVKFDITPKHQLATIIWELTTVWSSIQELGHSSNIHSSCFLSDWSKSDSIIISGWLLHIFTLQPLPFSLVS